MSETKETKSQDSTKSVEPKVTKPKGNKRTLAEILAFHNDKIKKSNKVMVGNKDEAAFDYIANTSGGLYMIPDLRARDVDPKSQEMIVLQPGEIINLLAMFEPISINRNRAGLLPSFKMKSNLHKDLPALTCIEHDEIEFPIALSQEGIVKIAVAKGQGQIADPGYNEYDIKLQKDYEKEEADNKRMLDKIKNKVDFNKRKSAEEVKAGM